MSHALRAELAYLRPWLLGGLGLALGVAALVTAIFATTAPGPPAFVAAAIRAMFPMTAPMIVAFIVQNYRNAERRERLFLAGPLTPRRLGILSVLLPVVLGLCGVVTAGLVVGLDSLITGAFAFETVHIVGYVGGLCLLSAQMGLLLQENLVCVRQRRTAAAIAGWATLFAGTLLLAAVSIAAFARQGPWTWPLLHTGDLVAAVGFMVVTVLLYSGRSDFTG